MMNMQNHIKLIYLILIVAMGYACSSGDSHTEHQTIQAKLDAISVDSIEYDANTLELLEDLEKVMAELPDSTLQYYVPKRSSVIKSFPCSNCHTKSLEELNKLGESELKKAHWNVQLSHAKAEVMECRTCHNSQNMDELVTITGKAISIDRSYQQCGQCHSGQYKEWQGGAHGKRLGGWVPPRVSNTCTNCHDPHAPAFESRWPARLNTVKLKEQSADK